MSKRLRNKPGRQGRSKWNAQWLREHRMMSAKRKHAQALLDAALLPDPLKGFF